MGSRLVRQAHVLGQFVGKSRYRLEHLWVIYPGHEEYTLDDKITVIPIYTISRLADSLHYAEE
ncbi:MAG: hypothetical protein JSW12_05255 [Deltaproteobacteria bacterium]|nr:MAG: hypothetical protein JSW12_05255 [Deltaproteobacteria bacterium]